MNSNREAAKINTRNKNKNKIINKEKDQGQVKDKVRQKLFRIKLEITENNYSNRRLKNSSNKNKELKTTKKTK